MSKKDYIAVAALLADRALAARGNGKFQVARITVGLADIFEAGNPNFDRGRFLNASGYRPEDVR